MELQAIEKFLTMVEQFSPFQDGSDLIWLFFIKVKRSWRRVSVQKYQGVYYVSASGRLSFSYPGTQWEDLEEELGIWAQQLSLYKAQLSLDPITAQARLFHALPMKLRYGVISRRNVKLVLSDWVELNFGVSENEKADLLEILRGRDGDAHEGMTASRYFDYCRIAYLANPETSQDLNFIEGLSGREYYRKYADGRHGGLLDLDPDSEQDFRKWYKSGSSTGCHPWEIYRGGNSTHINLAVTKALAGDGFQVFLEAFSTSRLLETCRIALALKKANFPFTLAHKKSYLDRMLEQDWVGIIPKDSSIKYGRHEFPKEYELADCIHLDWIFEANPKEKHRRLRQQLKQLVFWLPERISA